MKRMNYRPNLIEARAVIEDLSHFTGERINQMLIEIPTNLVLCEQFYAILAKVDEELRLIIKFWRLNMVRLPYLALLVRYAYCITLSSASVEYFHY